MPLFCLRIGFPQIGEFQKIGSNVTNFSSYYQYFHL